MKLMYRSLIQGITVDFEVLSHFFELRKDSRLIFSFRFKLLKLLHFIRCVNLIARWGEGIRCTALLPKNVCGGKKQQAAIFRDERHAEARNEAGDIADCIVRPRRTDAIAA